VSARNTTLALSAVACLLLAITSDVRAEEVENKFRLGFSVGTFGTSDDQHSPSANARVLFLPDGQLEDVIYDPRNDSAAIGNFGIEAQNGATLSASYAFTRFWYVEASAGYRHGNVSNVEVQAEFDGAPIPNVQQFNFSYFNIDAGTITQIPVQLTAGIRFRPKAAFNPYLYAGVGYSFNSFTPSDELNDLSTSLDQSTGGFAVLQGTSRSGESLAPSTSDSNLSGITVDVPSAPEWHFGGGLEFTVHSRWAIFLDARYTVYSGEFGLTVNGSEELGISVPSDQAIITNPGAFGPFGAVQIKTGGLLDGGSYVPKVGFPPNACDNGSTVNCELTGPLDGIKDPGFYYVHAGHIRYDGTLFQLGVKFTF
jgi:opacity protein-like surface antigen